MISVRMRPFLHSTGYSVAFHNRNQSSLSDNARREIETIEAEYGLDLHQNWRTHLPKDLLVVCVIAFSHSQFDHQIQPSDEELARVEVAIAFKKRRGYKTNTTSRLRNDYFAPVKDCAHSDRVALRDTPPSYRNTEQPYESSISDVLAKKTKALKDKFKNFWYERKGYQRVNVSEGGNGSNENGGVSVCA